MPVFLVIAACCALPVAGAVLLLRRGASEDEEETPDRVKAPKVPAWRKLLGPGKFNNG